jgi:hypothetical protein
MSNVQSYNALIDRFKAFASGHFILKRFSHGQIEVSDLEKFGEYPFMHVIPSNVTYSQGMKTFSFQIVLADLPRDKEDKSEYQREALSDLQRIAEDLIAEITNHRVLFGDLITVNNVSLEPFLEEFQHTLTGWTVSLDLLVPYYWDACSIPAEWNDFFESGSGGTGSILTFIDSITRDENGNVSLVNDEAEPSPNYYYGTNDEGVRGWYLLSDEVGLTCVTLPSCQTIIDIEAAIDDLQEEILLKANTADLGAVAFSNDYNDLDNKPTIPTGTVTSVGLTMPSAFSVANSPITSSGDIAVTGAGTVSQYVRGDGSLATFPSSTGGGASLSFYLNGSVSQGTFGGVAFREMDRTPILGAGTDFTIATNGYIQSFITDANVPNLLEIPAGNWNFETYFSASSNGGTPSYYIELYKWNGTTLSLIASGSANPEGITNGTATHLYVSAIAVPQTTLALTDRLAVRIYVNNSGRTIKLHTENGHLCQVITTFSTGLTALNGLTAQVQNFATGTSGTDFGISSATSTHTFNLPTASATNRGALSSTDWSTFNGKFNLPALTSGSVLFSNGTTIAQDNANLFWDDTNKRFRIGAATTTSKFSVTDDVLAEIQSAVYSNTAGNAGAFLVRKSRGSIASPSALLSGDRLGGFFFSGNNTGSGFHNPCALIGFAAENFTGSAAGGYLAFETTANGTTSRTEKMRLLGNGNILIGTTTDAGFRLDVNGTARVSGAATITAQTKIGTTVYTDASSGLILGKMSGQVAARGFLASDTNYQDFGFINTNISSGNVNSWTFGQRRDTAFGNALGSFLIVGGYWSNSGIPSPVGGGYRVPLICNPDGTVIIAGASSNAINGNVLVGTTTDVASSKLTIESTTQGFLPPRMTTTQKNAIASPAVGLVVYDTTLGKLCVRGASAWETITSV